ncbi:MAG: autotransporter outer membrane beta-barrel domain-containing protein [Hyphomicrobium sp.]
MASSIFEPQSVYEVEVDRAGRTDLIDATGTATMNGGTVAITALGPVSLGTRYTILTAAGGRNGEFDGVSGGFAFITPTLGYDSTDVFLIFARNATGFVDVAQTPNERATAAALDQFPAGNELFDLVLSGTAADARQAFDALSGEVHASAASALIMNSFYVRDAIFSRLIQASYSAPGGAPAALGATGPTTVTALDPGSRMSLGAGLDDIGISNDPPTPGHGLAFWTRGFGAWGNLDGNGNAAGLNRTLGGFVSGR